MKKSGFFIAKFLKTLSILTLIAVLLYAYYYLPEKLVTHFSKLDMPDEYMSKSGFFYGVGIIAVVFYAFSGLLSKMVQAVEVRYFIMPNREYWTSTTEAKMYFYKIFSEWISSLSLLINLFLIICVFVVLKSHGRDTMSMHDFKLLPLIGGMLFLFWIIFLPIILRIKKNDLLN